MNTFTDMHGRTICDGAEIYFNGQFPAQVPEESRIRNGIAIIEDDKLVFAVIINDQLHGIGLYWEFDNEPCYDLTISNGLTRNRYRLEFYDALADKLIAFYEGDDLNSLYAQGFHHLERGYGVEIDNAKTIKYRGITAEIIPCRQGYKCEITDTLGNDVSWFVCAESMPEAIAKAERHFDSAINYLRGFIILPELLKRIGGYYA